MNKFIYIILSIFFFSCKEYPKTFSRKALDDNFLNLQGNLVSFKDIIETHKGKTILIDIWASWCGDCRKAIPKVKALQSEFKEVAFVFLSLDRDEKAWKHSIKKYKIEGDHYYFPNGKSSDFADFLNISWIPRYLLINKASEIVVFNVIEADDDKLIDALKK